MTPPSQALAAIERVEEEAGLALVTGWVRLPPGRQEAALRLDQPGLPSRELKLRRFVERVELAGEPPAQGFVLGLFESLAGARLSLWLDGAALTEALPVTPRVLAPCGAIEFAGARGIAGWLFASPLAGPATLLVDGRLRLALPCTEARPDLPFDFGESAPLLGFRMTPSALGDVLQAHEPGLALLDGKVRSLVLLSGGQELARTTFCFARSLIGALEILGPESLQGWAADVPGERIVDPPAVEVTLEGTRWLRVPAATFRADLRAEGIGSRTRGGALSLALPSRNPSDVSSPMVALRPAHGRAELPGAMPLEGLAAFVPSRDALADAPAQADWPRIAIVIPVFNAADDLDRCLTAVLRHTTGPARLILVDDASTDPAVAALLAPLHERTGIEVHRNAANLGFSATVNRGMALAAPDDVVLLNADTIVGPGWLDGLRLAAMASRRVGTVTAISNNAGAFSAPEFDVENTPPGWFEPADLARLARQAALGLWPRMPTGNGFCLLITRACLDAVGDFDVAAFPRGYGEENDFCQRASRAGFAHVVDDRTLVWHRRGASFLEAREALMRAGEAVLAARYPEYPTLVGAFRDDSDMLAMRWRLRHALAGAQEKGSTPRPRVLFVLSSRSGGTPLANRDLMQALEDRYEGWTLFSDGTALELTRHGEDTARLRHRLSRPLLPGDHRSAEYDRSLREILLRFGFELVHVRHIAWHGLGLVEVCRSLGLPVVFSFHDFYTVCPTIKLIDAEGGFCAGRCTRGEGDCTPELWAAGAMPALRDRFVHRWRAMLGAALEGCDAFVTTSDQATDLLRAHFPFLAGRDLRLIPHGRDFPQLLSLAVEPMLGERLRVLVPGNILAAKGGDIIAALAALDLEQDIEFHILGTAEGSLGAPQGTPAGTQMRGVVLHGPYERDDFATHVARIRPHLGAVLSLWPETHCHTLSECWSVGLPVLGIALGAVEERITATGAGWLVARDTPPEEILALLQGLKRDSNAFRARRERVLDWQRDEGRHLDTAAMAARYDALYRDIAARRRSLAPAGDPTPVVMVLHGAPAEGGFRLALPLRNDTSRLPIYRPASPAASIGGSSEAGRADLVIIPAGTLPPRDLEVVLQRCRAASMPVLLEIDARLARRLGPGGGAPALASALGQGLVTALAADAEALQALADRGFAPEALPAALDPFVWSVPLHEAPPPPPEGKLRVLVFDDGPGWPALRTAMESLAALDVAEVVALEAAPPAGAEARLRARAAGCGVGVLLSHHGLVERRLALAHAGLPLLRTAGPGESPGETALGELLVAPGTDGLVQALGMLSVDPARLAALARRSAAQAPERPSRAREAALDALVLRLLGR